MSVTELRPAILGGSTIGAACGIDPWCSPIRLWLELTRGTGREETEAIRWGKRLEPLIFAALREQGYSAEGPFQGEIHDAERAWLIGHPDGYDGEAPDMRIVEAKAAGHGYNEPPPHWLAQVQTYLHLTGLDEAVIAQLAGLRLTVWEVERDQHAIDTLLRLGEEFVGYVERREQPPPQGHPDDRAAILDLHPEPDHGTVRRETKEVRDARRELAALLEAEKARKARIEHLRAVVTDHLADADTLISAHDDVVATWKQVTSRRLDAKALKEQRPELYDEYAAETTTRRLVLT